LNILEEFLEGYQGCMLMVTHDRYFMDRLVDHVFVLDGTGVVKDIHGNYTDYRELFEISAKQQAKLDKAKAEKAEKEEEKIEVAPVKKSKLSYKEQRELETIEKELEDLEVKKKSIVDLMNDTNQSHDALANAAIDYQKMEAAIDLKTLRWLELQEK
jgi:ATP-binding cassette subfamily F protein uup